LQHSVSTILQNLWTTLVLLLLTPRFGEGMTLVGICQNNFLMLKSNPRVQWSPCSPRGLPKGRYHVVSRALTNSGLLAHMSMGCDPQL